MSKRSSRTWTVRLDEEKYAFAQKIVQNVIKTQSFSGPSERPDGFMFILNRFDAIPEKEIPSYIPDLEQRINCDYLRRDNVLNEWVCDETVLKKRASTVLGNNPEVVLAMCNAHKLKFQELEKKKIQEILAKKTVKNAVNFTKKFMKIAEDGFGAGCFMCTAMWYEKGILRGSQDNKTLECHKIGKSVDIKTVCREAINISTGVPPCEYFIEFVHTVHFDDIEEFKEVDPEIGPLPCNNYDTPECPGIPMCSVNRESFAQTGRYCPEMHSPKIDIPLLE